MITHSRPTLDPEDFSALAACLETRMINEGKLTQRLEFEVLRRFGGAAALGCGSGSQALMLALKALKVGAGDEVILPSYVCGEVAATVEALQATPVIVDVDDEYLIDFGQVASARTHATKAIIVPYVMGIWRDPSPLLSLEVPIIEDCAQYMPTSDRWTFTGDLAVFSFEATKVIAAGEGGLVLARTGNAAERLQGLKRLAGTDFKLNLYPLADVLAALALRQLAALDSFLARRQKLAAYYMSRLASLRDWALPRNLGQHNIFFRFPMRYIGERSPDFPDIFESLEKLGVICRRPVDGPLHQVRTPRLSCGTAERLCATTLSIPIYPSLTDAEAKQVVDALLSTLN